MTTPIAPKQVPATTEANQEKPKTEKANPKRRYQAVCTTEFKTKMMARLLSKL
jgi:hypothetical protein